MSRFGLFILVLLSFSSLFSQIPSYVPTNGLVAWWPFNGNANDESGNGNNGTVNGATLTSDRFGNVGKAYSFNGISDFIDLRSSVLGITGNSDRTISCWINTSAQNVQTVFASGSGVSGNPCSNNGKTYNLRLVNSKLGVMTYNCGNCSSCDLYPQSGSNLTDNNWHNVTVFMKSDTAYTYVDGFFENTQFMPNTNTTADSNFIGKDNHIGYLDYFDGKIDDLAIWNRALTQQEITELYTSSDPFDVSATTTTVCAGQPTTLSVQSVSGTITALNCASATNTGTLIAGTAASGVSSSIPYTGGNGGTHNSQIVSSTGVTGLTATLTSGTFASGNGSLTYTITGTPSASGTASFALNIGGQTCALSLNVEVNVANASCGASFVHNPNLSYGTVVDQDGNTYKTIVIGSQEWMSENLKTSTYSNGEPIPNVTDPNQWSNVTTGAWAHYNNDSQNECPYGKLYNWHTLVHPSNVCPAGWHVPTDAEWNILTDYLGGPSAAGGKMKSTGTQYWLSPNTDATNQSGFSGLPGGYRAFNGNFYDLGSMGWWWREFEGDFNPWNRLLSYQSNGVSRSVNNNYNNGFSVRCLKD